MEALQAMGMFLGYILVMLVIAWAMGGLIEAWFKK